MSWPWLRRIIVWIMGRLAKSGIVGMTVLLSRNASIDMGFGPTHLARVLRMAVLLARI